MKTAKEWEAIAKKYKEVRAMVEKEFETLKIDVDRPLVNENEKDSQPFKNTIFTGAFTNAIMATNDDIGTIKRGDFKAGTKTEYRTIPLNGVQFLKNDLFDNTLTPQTQRLFLYNICKLAQTVKKGETDINKIRDGNLRPFSLTEYMTACGLKDRKKTTKIIKESIKELINTRVNYKFSMIIDGKEKIFMKNTDILSLTIDVTDLTNKQLTKEQYLEHCIEKGFVYMSFDLDLTSAIVNFPLLDLPTQLFKLDIRHSPHALNAGYYLINLANQGRFKVSLDNLIKACPDLPLYRLNRDEHLVDISKQGQQKDSVRLYKHILEPLKKTLEALKKNEILESYLIVDKAGKETSLEKINKEVLDTSFIKFKLTDKAKPLTDKELAKKIEYKAQIQNPQKKKKKK